MDVRVPPSDLKAEEAVLSSMIQSRNAIHEVMEIVKEEDFYREANKKIFEAILALEEKKEPVDIITLSNELKRREEFETVGGLNALTGLMNSHATPSNATHYAVIVRDKAVSRAVINASAQIVSDGFADIMPLDEFLNDAEIRFLQATERRQSKDAVDCKTFLPEAYEAAHEASKKEGGITGLSTRFHWLDEMTCGFQNGDLIIIGARTSVGKTCLALNLAQDFAFHQSLPILFFSLEMNRKKLAQRILSSEAKIELKKIVGGTFNEVEQKRLTKRMGDLYEKKFFIDDTPRIAVMELASKARRFKKLHGIRAVMVDYVGLVQPGKNFETREQAVSFISGHLKALATDLNVPIFVMSQVSRQLKGQEEKRPLLSDLRESGALEQDADVVIFIHREKQGLPAR